MSFRIIGRILNAHGLEGGLQVLLTVPDRNVLRSLKILFTGRGNYPDDVFHVRNTVNQSGGAIIYSEEIKNRDAALQFKNWNIFIPEADTEPEIVDERPDLTGFQVFAAVDESLIGTVTDMLDQEQLAHPILVVKNGEREHLIPFIEEFIVGIDLKLRQIFIDVQEGLLDED